MANWSNPTLTSLYTDFLSELKARDTDLALQFDGTTSTNLSTGTIRWDSSANRWKKWNGSAWAELTTTYALTGLSTTGNASIGGTLSVTGSTTLAAATATTPATNDNSTAVATTAYVRAQAYAPLASPALTGTPTAPTAAVSTNTTQLATTAFVLGQISNDALAKSGGTLTGALQAIAGTVTAPGVGIGESDTGLFRPSAGVLAFSRGGTEVFRATAANGLALGSTGTNVNVGFRHTKNITGGTTAWAQLVDGVVQSDVTTTALGVASSLGTAGSQTIASLIHFQASTGTIGASTTLTNQIGFAAASSMEGATNDYGFFGNIGAGTGNWNCYMGGAAPNFFNGQVQLGAGSIGTPSLSTNGDTNTGVFFPAADELAFVTGGTQRVEIDSSGRLLVGATSDLGSGRPLQVLGNGAALQYSATDTAAAALIFDKTRGTSASPLSVSSGDNVGRILFRGYNSTSATLQNCAEIAGQIDGTPSETSTDMPGRLVFSTSANSSSSPTEQFRLTSDRYLRLASGTGGIQFDGNTTAATALDDYEEGTFTPTIVGTGTAGTGTYSVQVGRYTKIGQRVHFQINLTWSAHTGTTNMIVGALPFTSANVANAVSAVSVRHSNLTSPASTVVQGFVASNATTITLESVAVAGGAAAALAMDTAATLTVSGHYEAA
jgi:hypothetical protein